MHARIGERLTKDQPLCTVYAKNEETFARARDMIVRAVHLSDAPCAKEKLLYCAVTRDGVIDLTD